MTLLAQFAATGGGVPQYIEDVFSTYLYTGTSAPLAIVNGIDLAGKGGLVWSKWRSGVNAFGHALYDTNRGPTKQLQTQTTAAESTQSRFTSFNSNGYSLSGDTELDYLGDLYASWTFREQSKFFDVVTWTGNGVSGRQISHNLGSAPGCLIVKCTSDAETWLVWQRTFATRTTLLQLNTTNPTYTDTRLNTNTVPTSTYFEVGSDGEVNGVGRTYVAYLFAHDAGGFGLSGSENVISCGNYTCVASPGNVTVTLGYEPQWVMVKNATQASNWVIYDNMRGMPGTVPPNPVTLAPDSAAAENGVTGSAPGISPTATGFIARAGLTAVSGSAGDKVIYIAIRRGPMKVPTTGTSVFSPNLAAAQGQLTTGFPVDLGMWNYRTGYSENTVVNDRLRGVSSTNSVTNANNLITSSNAAEAASQGTRNWNNTGLYAVSGTAVFYSFGRAPGFFDEVCYTGDGGVYSTQNHNLTVVPELIIAKCRNAGFAWQAWASEGNVAASATGFGVNSTSAAVYRNQNFSTYMLATTFTPGLVYDQSANSANAPGNNYVAYLFATCAGVSKVGTYTGTGTTQTINCGFTAGARFVLIKRTDSTGDWYVWDSARGIIAGNDPYILMNTIAAEVTSTDYVDTDNTGFQLSSTAPAALNASGGSYIFLAIA
jgi:hypothetical protein